MMGLCLRIRRMMSLLLEKLSYFLEKEKILCKSLWTFFFFPGNADHDEAICIHCCFLFLERFNYIV